MSRDDRKTGVFDRAAATYGRVGPDFFSDYGARLVELARVDPGSRVLDVAAGTGAGALVAARATGPAGSVLATDLSYQMLQKLHGAARARALVNIEVAQMDAQRLAFRPRTFDYVLCGFALHSFSNPENALDEIHSVLRPGGKFACSTAPWWWWEGDDEWQWHADLLEALGMRTSAGDPSLGEPQTLKRILAAAGFMDCACSIDLFQLSFNDQQEWWDWAWSHGYRSVLEAMNPAELARYKDACFRELERPDSAPIRGRLKVCLAVATKSP